MSEFQNEYTWGKFVADNSTEKFQTSFDKAIDKVKDDLGKTYPIIINGKEIYSDDCFEVRSSSNTEITVGKFPNASTKKYQ